MTKGQLLIPVVAEQAPKATDLGASFARVLRAAEDTVAELGHKEVAIDLDVRGSFLTDALHDRNGAHLYALHLAYLNINSSTDDIAAEFAAQRGLELRGRDESSELEEFKRSVIERFGQAGAEHVAKWSARRSFRRAVNIPTRIRK